MSAGTVKRPVQQHGHSAHPPWFRLPWIVRVQRRSRTQKWHSAVFSDESWFCLLYLSGRNHGECTLLASLQHHHPGPSPGVMVWGGIGNMSSSPLPRIGSILNSGSYISAVLRPATIIFIRALWNTIMHELISLILFGTSFIHKMIDCCPDLSLH